MALQRVEVLGPSGVGKSTILRAVADRWKTFQVRRFLLPEDMVSRLGKLRENTTAGQRTRRAVDAGLPKDFFDTCFRIIGGAGMLPSQKFSAAALLRRSCEDLHDISSLDDDGVLVHDELLLHRAFSLLPRCENLERDARDYFEQVPVPDLALIIKAEASVIHGRVLQRRHRPNCYRDLSDSELEEVIQRLLQVCDIAQEVLKRRGVDVHVISSDGAPGAAAEHLVTLVQARWPSQPAPIEAPLMERLLESSTSFRKKDGRHELRTRRVAYCSFSTQMLVVPKKAAQRDAGRRLARFDLTRSQVEGKSVLDLGCNSGAMLFELSNRGIRSGLGIEYDSDKVALAKDIARASRLETLEFCQGDIDEVDAGKLGRFDVVLALAVEAHVMAPEKLLQTLAAVTRGTLYFEGNGGCDIRAIGSRLLELGFSGIEFLGVCDDDVRPSNNNRPLLKAWKSPVVPEHVEVDDAGPEVSLSLDVHDAALMDFNQAIEFQSLRFARGFYFGSSRWVSPPPHWSQLAFGGGWLAFDDRVPVTVARGHAVELALVGRAFDLDARTADRQSIVRRLTAARQRSAAEMQKVVDGLAGRFVILDAANGEVRAQQDAAGMRTVFYLTRSRGWFIASHAQLLPEIVGDLEPSVFGNYWAGGGPNPLHGAYGYPGRASEFREVHALTPNTVLNVREGTLTRIFPTTGPGSVSAEAAGEWLAEVFQDQMRALADESRMVLSLTSGLDSRVTLAAAGLDLARRAQFFTYSPATRQSDIDVACAIGRDHKLEHELFNLKEFRDYPSEFTEALRTNSPRRHVHSAAYAYLMRFRQSDLHIRSNHYEVGRAFYMKHRPKKISRSVPIMAKRLLEKGGEASREIIRAFEEWVEVTQFPLDSDYLPPDLFYWEHRMSRWCAPNLCESDVAFDTWAVVNARSIYQTMLSVDFEGRIQGAAYHHIIRSRWPELLRYPVNGVVVK